MPQFISKKQETNTQENPHTEERPSWGEFTGNKTNEFGEYREPTLEERKKFEKGINHVSEIFENADFQWYLDGAINISLYRDKQIRDHKDLDISVFQEDLVKVNDLLTRKGFKIFVNFEENGKNLMREATMEELLTMDKPSLSIRKVDLDGKIQRQTNDSFNFIDLHIQSKDARGNTIVFYNGTSLPKEFFNPIEKELSNGKKINLSQPAIVAYHKLHSNRLYDLTDLQKLKSNLQEKDFTMLQQVLEKENAETKQKVKEKLQEAWNLLSPILKTTHDQKVISEKLWINPDIKERENDPKFSKYVSSISQYISESQEITFNDFLNQSLSILKPYEYIEQKLKIINELRK